MYRLRISQVHPRHTLPSWRVLTRVPAYEGRRLLQAVGRWQVCRVLEDECIIDFRAPDDWPAFKIPLDYRWLNSLYSPACSLADLENLAGMWQRMVPSLVKAIECKACQNLSITVVEALYTVVSGQSSPEEWLAVAEPGKNYV